ncbi:unnamed protein product, partial [Mesorhabditis spiculigera]
MYTEDELSSSIPEFTKKFGEVPLLGQKLQPGMKPLSLTELGLISSLYHNIKDSQLDAHLFPYAGPLSFAIDTTAVPEISIPAPYRWFLLDTNGVNRTFPLANRQKYLENLFKAANRAHKIHFQTLDHIQKYFPAMTGQEKRTTGYVADMTAFYDKLWEFYAGYNDTDLTKTNITLGELQELVPEIDWLKFLSNYTVGEQRKSLSMKTKVLLRGEKGMYAKYSTLLRDTTTMQNAAFFSWYAYVMNDRQLTRAPFCLVLWHEMFNKLSEHYVAKYLYADVDLGNVETLTESIRAAFVDVLADNKWLAPENKRFLIEKIKNTPAYLGYNKNALDLKVADELAEFITVPDDLSPIEQAMVQTRAKWVRHNYRQKCIVDQFGNVTHSNVYLNISVTGDGWNQKEEAAADHQGTLVAFRAYRKQRKRLFGSNPPKLPGLQKYTNDQLFFLAHAQNWCGQLDELKTPAYANIFKKRHPPYSVRVNEDMKNLEPFATAFKCPLNSPMNPEKKCRVWRRIKKR